MELTSVRYPHLKRGPFSQLTDSDVTHFSQLLGAERVLTEDLDGYNTDWMRSVRGGSGAAARRSGGGEQRHLLGGMGNDSSHYGQ